MFDDYSQHSHDNWVKRTDKPSLDDENGIYQRSLKLENSMSLAQKFRSRTLSEEEKTQMQSNLEELHPVYKKKAEAAWSWYDSNSTETVEKYLSKQ